MSRVLALGTFDLFHPGHVLFLEAAREQGTSLIVAVNTDEFAARYKRPPIMTLGERMTVVAACWCVDRVIVNTGCEDAKPAIIESGADVIVHGDDWTGGSYLDQLSVTPEWLADHKVQVVYVPYTQGISTSEVRDRCQYAAYEMVSPDLDGLRCKACGKVSTAAEITRRCVA
jgi:glycerol-3-phosphate cytidylyltransferase